MNPRRGEAVERAVAFDMVRRGAPVCAVLVAVAGLVWGADGAASAGAGVALVMANLLVAAAVLGWAATVSPAVLMGAALGGFLVRFVILAVSLALLRDQAWVVTAPLAATLLVTHVGLLVWETRHVSASLAFPALKPRAPGA